MCVETRRRTFRAGRRRACSHHRQYCQLHIAWFSEWDSLGIVTHTHTELVACNETCTPQHAVISIPAVHPNTQRCLQCRQVCVSMHVYEKYCFMSLMTFCFVCLNLNNYVVCVCLGLAVVSDRLNKSLKFIYLYMCIVVHMEHLCNCVGFISSL